MAKKFYTDRINAILDELKRDMITVDTVKQLWEDKHGCRFLPHSNTISFVIKHHKNWVHDGQKRPSYYRVKQKSVETENGL